MGMRSLNGESDGKGKMKEKLKLAVFGHKRWSREGGVEIVVKELQTLLKNGEKVLFSGTPCQVEAAKTIAKRFGGELYTIDIICHGCRQTVSSVTLSPAKQRREK